MEMKTHTNQRRIQVESRARKPETFGRNKNTVEIINQTESKSHTHIRQSSGGIGKKQDTIARPKQCLENAEHGTDKEKKKTRP